MHACACVRCVLTRQRALCAQPPVINNEALWGRVKPDDSLWEVETRGSERVVVVTLVKAAADAWDFLLKSEARHIPVGRCACVCGARGALHATSAGRNAHTLWQRVRITRPRDKRTACAGAAPRFRQLPLRMLARVASAPAT